MKSDILKIIDNRIDLYRKVFCGSLEHEDMAYLWYWIDMQKQMRSEDER